MAYPQYAQSKGGHSQAEKIYICPKCESLGRGNKMISHIKTCDGSGLKNYWSKKESIRLKKYLSSLF